MKYLITALLLVSLQAQAVPAQASEGSILAQCSSWADIAKLKDKGRLFKKAAFIIQPGENEFHYNYGIAEGITIVGKTASFYYYANCKSSEQYAKDLIAQTKT